MPGRRARGLRQFEEVLAAYVEAHDGIARGDTSLVLHAPLLEHLRESMSEWFHGASQPVDVEKLVFRRGEDE